MSVHDGPVAELTIQGPRGVADVWDRYVRPARWPEWSPQIRGVRYGHSTLRAGTDGVVTGPFGLGVPFRILEVEDGDPARRWWTWEVRLPGLRVLGLTLRLEHEVESRAPREGGGTLTRWRIHGPALVVLAYRPLAALALRRLVST